MPAAISRLIRPAVLSDCKAVHKIELEAFDGFSFPLSYFVQAVDIFQGGFSVEIVAQDIVGYVIACPTAERREQGWILSLVVKKRSRLQGIGANLLIHSIENLKEMGATFCRLTVADENVSAIRLYEKFGFRQLGMHAGDFGDGKGRLLYGREL